MVIRDEHLFNNEPKDKEIPSIREKLEFNKLINSLKSSDLKKVIQSILILNILILACEPFEIYPSRFYKRR